MENCWTSSRLDTAFMEVVNMKQILKKNYTPFVTVGQFYFIAN
jgi:hypothetical protein